MPGTIGEQFTRRNALTLVRLFLALSVIVWHAWCLRLSVIPENRLTWLAGDISVDAFFAISGFLIASSWTKRPDLRIFLTARARRLLPGLWVCLALTALVIYPAAATIADRPVPTLRQSLHYITGNALVFNHVAAVNHTTWLQPRGDWNGSLWTLGWEASGYLAVAVLGLAGLLRTRVIAGAVTLAWSLALVAELGGILPSPGNYMPTWALLRFTIMFGLGALLYLHRDRIPVDGRLAALAALTLPASLIVNDYRLVAAPGLAYLAIWAGITLGHHQWARLDHDLSYGVYVYGFPTQQAVLMVALAAGWNPGWLPFLGLSLLALIPLAAGSWFLVERPAQRWRRPRAVSEPVECRRLVVASGT